MTLAILSGALPKSFVQTLQRHKGKVGQSYDKIILELGVDKSMEKAAVKKSDPVVVEEAVDVASQIEDDA
jgi:hypothetical protein